MSWRREKRLRELWAAERLALIAEMDATHGKHGKSYLADDIRQLDLEYARKIRSVVVGPSETDKVSGYIPEEYDYKKIPPMPEPNVTASNGGGSYAIVAVLLLILALVVVTILMQNGAL